MDPFHRTDQAIAGLGLLVVIALLMGSLALLLWR